MKPVAMVFPNPKVIVFESLQPIALKCNTCFDAVDPVKISRHPVHSNIFNTRNAAQNQRAEIAVACTSFSAGTSDNVYLTVSI